MDLDTINISNTNELITLEKININTQEFYKIIEIIKLALSKMEIKPEGMKIYYRRNFDATSILAIQVTPGSDSDINNYMVNGCQSWRHGSDVSCDVYMHAEAKSAQKSMKLASFVSKDVVNFFEKIEQELLKNKNFDLSFSLMIPLGAEIEKKEKNVKNILKRILKRKNSRS